MSDEHALEQQFVLVAKELDDALSAIFGDGTEFSLAESVVATRAALVAAVDKLDKLVHTQSDSPTVDWPSTFPVDLDSVVRELREVVAGRGIQFEYAHAPTQGLLSTDLLKAIGELQAEFNSSSGVVLSVHDEVELVTLKNRQAVPTTQDEAAEAAQSLREAHQLVAHGVSVFEYKGVPVTVRRDDDGRPIGYTVEHNRRQFFLRGVLDYIDNKCCAFPTHDAASLLAAQDTGYTRFSHRGVLVKTVRDSFMVDHRYYLTAEATIKAADKIADAALAEVDQLVAASNDVVDDDDENYTSFVVKVPDPLAEYFIGVLDAIEDARWHMVEDA